MFHMSVKFGGTSVNGHMELPPKAHGSKGPLPPGKGFGRNLNLGVRGHQRTSVGDLTRRPVNRLGQLSFQQNKPTIPSRKR
jgi:hypothetical protein